MTPSKVKYLQPPRVHDFAEDLAKILRTFGLSLTNTVMVEQARILKDTKYPDLKKRGRRGGDHDINLDFVRDILKSRGWEVRHILGRKRLHPPEVVNAFDTCKDFITEPDSLETTAKRQKIKKTDTVVDILSENELTVKSEIIEEIIEE